MGSSKAHAVSEQGFLAGFLQRARSPNAADTGLRETEANPAHGGLGVRGRLVRSGRASKAGDSPEEKRGGGPQSLTSLLCTQGPLP